MHINVLILTTTLKTEDQAFVFLFSNDKVFVQLFRLKNRKENHNICLLFLINNQWISMGSLLKLSIGYQNLDVQSISTTYPKRYGYETEIYYIR